MKDSKAFEKALERELKEIERDDALVEDYSVEDHIDHCVVTVTAYDLVSEERFGCLLYFRYNEPKGVWELEDAAYP